MPHHLVSSFHQNSIPINEQWLQSQFPNLNSTYDEAYNKFLNTDLTLTLNHPTPHFSTNYSCIESIHHEHLFTTSPSWFQIIDILDISKSIIKQIDNINGIVAEEEFEEISGIKNKIKEKEFKIKSKRTLKLILSDGIKEMVACELESIIKLNENLKLGTKIKLFNVMVLRGVLMLKPNNIEVMSGELSDLDQNLLNRLEYKLKMIKDSNCLPIKENNQLLNERVKDNKPIPQPIKSRQSSPIDLDDFDESDLSLYGLVTNPPPPPIIEIDDDIISPEELAELEEMDLSLYMLDTNSTSKNNNEILNDKKRRSNIILLEESDEDDDDDFQKPLFKKK